MRWPYLRDIEISWPIKEHGEDGLEKENYKCTGNQTAPIGSPKVISLQGGFDTHQCRTGNETAGDQGGPFDFIDKRHCHDVEHKPSELKPGLEVQNLNTVEPQACPDDGSIVYNC